MCNHTHRPHARVYAPVLNNRSPESPSPGTIMPSSESWCPRAEKRQAKPHTRPDTEGTHHVVYAAGVDLQSGVRLCDARQAGLGTEDREDLDLRDLQAPVELQRTRTGVSSAHSRHRMPIPPGVLTRMEMAATAVPPVAIKGSSRYSVSTVGVGGSFWYCGAGGRPVSGSTRQDQEGPKTHVFDGLERDFFAEQAEVEHARFGEQVEDCWCQTKNR